MKLNQVIAVNAGKRKRVTDVQTEAYQLMQKDPLFRGFIRTYDPRDEDGFQYPGETQKVSEDARELMKRFHEAMVDMLNLAATQDRANQQAVGDIVVDGDTLVPKVPVTNLMYLERQLVDLRTFINSVPTLPIDRRWTWNTNEGVYETDKKQAAKTKKTTNFVEASPATKEHPAQIREVTNDIPEGIWTVVEMSSGLPRTVIMTLTERVNKLIDAVKKAREQANDMTVKEENYAGKLLNYVWSDVLEKKLH